MKQEALVIEGDVAEVVEAFGERYFDGCLCDPPYGIKFMGKSWDHGVPSSEVWEKVGGVLRPGAGLLAFGGTRTFHRLAVAIEDAGLEVRDTLCWLYGSGFPKSLDVSKAIDKEARGFPQGTNRCDPSNPNAGKFKTQRTEGKRGETDKGQHFGAGPGQFMREASSKRDYKLTVDSALPWTGYGTALKPAWEPIILAMAPLAGTFASNALAHGVAGLNVDGCRVGTGKRVPGSVSRHPGGIAATGRGIQNPEIHGGHNPNLGRWPANVVLDEEAAMALDAQTGELRSGDLRSYERSNRSGWAGDMPSVSTFERSGDSGGPSRFFYCAKSSKRERNSGGPNSHPTVKPLALCEYLARLILPPPRADGEPRRLVVPYSGSGSEILGALRAGWEEVIGIELEPSYVQLSERRIAKEIGGQ